MNKKNFYMKYYFLFYVLYIKMEFNSLTNVKNSADAISQFLTPLDNRSTYDSCHQDLRLKEAIRPGMYHLTERTMTTPSCYFDYQIVSGRGLPVKNDQIVDLESELRGITHINSKCDDQRLKRPTIFKKSSNLETVPYCSDFLTPTDTREMKSCKSTSEIQLNRFDYTLDDINIQPNSYIGMNTRLQVKKMIEKDDSVNAFINKHNQSKY
jgi:hypothetical protein